MTVSHFSRKALLRVGRYIVSVSSLFGKANAARPNSDRGTSKRGDQTF